jgi:hypothetical protein
MHNAAKLSVHKLCKSMHASLLSCIEVEEDNMNKEDLFLASVLVEVVQYIYIYIYIYDN